MTNDSQIIYSWTSPEFLKKERSRLWFWLAGLAGLLFFIAALWMENYIFAIIVPLFVFVTFSQASREPKQIQMSVSSEGIFLEEELTPFKEIKSFWIFGQKDLPYVSMRTKKNLKPNLFIPIKNEDPEKIKEMLLEFIPMEEQEESLIDSLAEKLKI
jgi:hypothetical protein